MAEPHVNGTMCLLRDDFQRGANSRIVTVGQSGCRELPRVASALQGFRGERCPSLADHVAGIKRTARLVIAPSEGDAMTGPTDRAVRPSFNPPPRWHPQPGPHYPVLLRDARHSTVRVILAIAQSRQNNLAATAPSREPERLDAPCQPGERLDQAQPRARSPDLDSLAHAGLLGRCWGRSRALRCRGVLARLTSKVLSANPASASFDPPAALAPGCEPMRRSKRPLVLFDLLARHRRPAEREDSLIDRRTFLAGTGAVVLAAPLAAAGGC